MERVYTIPLRREYRKAAIWRRTKRAMNEVRTFLSKHMKSDDVRIGTDVNEFLWKHGGKNPPHKVKVTVTKDENNVVKASLFTQSNG
jgi:large subunit ribosomal protein L31e